MGKNRELAEKYADTVIGETKRWVAPSSWRARLAWACGIVFRPARTMAALRSLMREQAADCYEKDMDEYDAKRAQACAHAKAVHDHLAHGTPLPPGIQVFDVKFPATPEPAAMKAHLN